MATADFWRQTIARLTPEQQRYVQEIAGRTSVPSRTSVTEPLRAVNWDEQASAEAARLEKLNRSRASHQRLVRLGQIATVAPFAAAGGAALAAGSASVPGAVGASTAPLGGGTVTAAGGASMASRIPWLRLGEIGAGTVTNLIGMRAQNRANDRAFGAEQAAIERAERLQAQQMEEDKRRWEAEQEQARLDREAANEERAWRRHLEEQDAALRRASWDAGANRRAIRDAALISLGGVGRSTTMPVNYTPPSAVTSPTREAASSGRGSARYITPAGQYDYRPRLIPLSQVGY